MRYTASVFLKQADTSGRIPASVLDEFVRKELISQIGAVLKPYLTVSRGDVTDETQTPSQVDRVDFTTELIILPGERWNWFKEQLGQWGEDLSSDKTGKLQTLLASLEKPGPEQT